MNVLRRALLGWALKGTDLTLTDPSGWEFLTGGPTFAGMSVGEKTQLQIDAAFSAIRLISETIGTLPLHLYVKTARGRSKATDHPLYELVHRQPNEYMTSAEWKESMAVSLVTMGQSYNIVSRFDSTGRVVSIQPVHKSRVKPEILPDGSILYRYTDRMGRMRELRRPDVCPIRGFGGAGDLEGYAPHVLHRETLAFSLAVERYGAEFFGDPRHPSGYLSTDDEFRTSQRDQIRENFSEYIQKSWRERKLPLLERKLKYVPIFRPNSEAQFVEVAKQLVTKVARVYRVPLHMLMEMDKASYNNTEQANKHFLDYTLMAYLVRIEQGLSSSLLTATERAKGYYFEFDLRGLLRGDSTQRAAYYLQMRTAGAITQNEIRVSENMDEIEGADDLHVPLNMAPSDLLRSIQTRE